MYISEQLISICHSKRAIGLKNDVPVTLVGSGCGVISAGVGSISIGRHLVNTRPPYMVDVGL